MGKIRKCKLSWQPSNSEEVIGYRLYWSKGDRVDYDSNFFELGKVHEVCLPDVLKLDTRYETSIMLGITAVAIEGNESDMVTLPAPYRTKVPPPPSDLGISTTDDITVMETDHADRPPSPPDPARPTPEVEPQKLQRPSGTALSFKSTESRIKYYDDLGYRKLEID
jgi:hypothetical protein